MNRKLIVRVLGALLAIEGLAMIPAFLVSLYYRDGDTYALANSLVATLIVGSAMPSQPVGIAMEPHFAIMETSFVWAFFKASSTSVLPKAIEDDGKLTLIVFVHSFRSCNSSSSPAFRSL